MTLKPDQSISKTSRTRSVRKSSKGPTETSSLFVDVNEVIRRMQTVALTRYVE
jgi:hypothetical protein